MTYLTDYIKWCDAHPKQTCQKTKQVILRIKKMLAEAEKPKCKYFYDEAEPKKIITFLEKLIVDESGAKLKPLLWQKFFVACIYGWRYKDGGRIVFNDAFLFIAKKNGKTSLIAGLALYNLITVFAAQVILVATVYNQAKIAFETIIKYIQNTPELREALDSEDIFIRESHPLNIVYYPTGSKIMIIPESQARAAQGFNATFAMFDEIASYRTGSIIEKVASGQVRENAIRISMTTAETSMQNPGRLEYDRAAQVLAGHVIASNYFPLVYELDKDDDKENERNYSKANPALDIIKPLHKILEERERANQNPVERKAWEAYHLNIWSQNASADISDEDWLPAIDAFGKYRAYLTDEKLATYPSFAAIDLSKIDDYTGYTIYFYIHALNKFYARHRFYIPAAMLEKKLRVETEQLGVWVQQGLVTATLDGQGDRVINYDYLEQDIIHDYGKFNLLGLTYDVAHASKFITGLDEKTPQLAKIPFAQGWKKISPANKRFLEIVYKKQLIDANPVMRWMVGCVKINNDRIGNTYFEKINYMQSPLRIDGVDTSVMALAMLTEQIEQGIKSVEEQVKAIEAIDY